MLFFLSSGVNRACLNAVGKVPVRRDVLMMCVSAGKSVGEIAWRRCAGIESRGHGRCRMAGEEKFGYFCFSEGTEGEDGSLSSGCGWLEVRTTNCSIFFCEESGKIISYYRSGGRWWRVTEEIIKCWMVKSSCREWNVLKRLRVSGALLILLWKYDDLAVRTSAERD